MPEVESESGLVNKAYEGVIEYINEYVPPTVKKVENNPVNLTQKTKTFSQKKSSGGGICSERLDALKQLNEQLKQGSQNFFDFDITKTTLFTSDKYSDKET